MMPPGPANRRSAALVAALLLFCNFGCDGRIIATSFQADAASDIGGGDAEPIDPDGGGFPDALPEDVLRPDVDRPDVPDAGPLDAEPVDGDLPDADVLDGDVLDAMADTGVHPPFVVGGAVTGLSGVGLVLRLNGANDLPINADGVFMFAPDFPDGAVYEVVVAVQPGSPLQHCRVDRGRGTINGGDVQDIGISCAAVALYPGNGPRWNDRVLNDGAGPLDATDAACIADAAGRGCSGCLHGGEMRVFEVPDVSRCTGLTIADDLGAFDWTCDDTGGRVRGVSLGLRADRSLTDLLDPGTTAWRPNSMTVTESARRLYATAPQVWWDNPVVEANAGLSAGQAAAYTIYVITQDGAGQAVLDAEGAALVVAPGARIGGLAPTSVVLVDGAPFVWFEGGVDATNRTVGVQWRNASCGVMRAVDVMGAGTRGVVIEAGARNIRLTNVAAHDNQGGGVELRGLLGAPLTGVQIDDLTLRDNGAEGLLGTEVDGLSANGLVAERNGGAAGVILVGVTDAVLEDWTVASNRRGLGIAGGSDLRVTNLSAHSNNGDGVRVVSAAQRVRLFGIASANNLAAGVRVEGGGHVLEDVRAFNNGDSGVLIRDCLNCAMARIFAASNGLGIQWQASAGVVARDLLIANNAGVGALASSTSRLTLASLVTVNNGDLGLSFEGIGTDVRAWDIAAAHNGSYGVSLGSIVTFSGGIAHGANGGSAGNPDCRVVPVAGGGLDATTCVPVSPSNATLTRLTSLADAWIGKVIAEDATNASDTGGAAQVRQITDWLGFATPERGWGTDNGADFPADGHRGRCVNGQCRIWDWSARGSDMLLRAVLPTPSGDRVIEQDWSLLTPALTQSDCNRLVPGSIFVAGFGGCRTTFLRAAIELVGEGGNDNALCESNELCLLAPNIGAYQGHGGLVAAPAPADGQLSGITMRRFSVNGR